MENNFEVTEEILNELASLLLNTNKTVKELSKHFNCDEIAILGILGMLKQRGNNIYKERKGEEIQVTSFGNGKIQSSNSYMIENNNHYLKILVLSDTWFGSVYSQPTIVNDVYRMAYNMGCSMAFHLGDITVGRYPKNDEEGYNSIYAHGYKAQLDEVINLYPYIPSMPTYFITGEHDHKHLGKEGLDIGNAINLEREDLIYLGPNRRDIIIHPTNSQKGIKIRLYHQEGTSTYQISYKSDQYIRAMRSEDKADIILQGHSLVSDEFVRRNMTVFQIPGLVGTAPEIAKNKRYKHNTVGAEIITIHLDKSYKIDNIIRGELPYYQTIDNDYKKAKQLVLKKGSN